MLHLGLVFPASRGILTSNLSGVFPCLKYLPHPISTLSCSALTHRDSVACLREALCRTPKFSCVFPPSSPAPCPVTLAASVSPYAQVPLGLCVGSTSMCHSWEMFSRLSAGASLGFPSSASHLSEVTALPSPVASVFNNIVLMYFVFLWEGKYGLHFG